MPSCTTRSWPLGVAGIVFAVHLSLPAIYGSGSTVRFPNRNEHLDTLALSAAYALSAGFAWLAVAMP